MKLDHGEIHPAPRPRRHRLQCDAIGRVVVGVGPYSEEGPTIQRLRDFIAAQGYVPSGKHHEIHLSDPRRSAPEKTKTIIRQPVAPTTDISTTQA